MNFIKRCMIKPGAHVELRTIDAGETFGWRKNDAKEQTAKNLEKIAELQEMMYAEQKRGLLICFQAMDTGGKDGVIKTIGGAMNPAGVRVVSFKAPTKEERAHDFLWRIKKQMPNKPGEIVIFNRSHYEDVGIVRVHNLVTQDVWSKRYSIINAFEKAAAKPGDTIPEGAPILKFFLHISPEEQLERLKERMDTPEKHWKVNEGDFKERLYWHDYMAAYGEAISRCSTAKAPWFVIPADHKWMRDLIISQILVDTLEAMKMSYPTASADVSAIREKYFDANGALKPEFDIDAAAAARKVTTQPRP